MSAAKRKRVDEGPGDVAIEARSKIWFTDGNIILEAEGTQFRVHRGVLANQSSVFGNMFDVPAPPDEPTVDGCPVVQISDSARDVEHLLNVLYNWVNYSANPLPVPILRAMLRLGHKYDFGQFRKEAISRLEYEFASDMKTFLERQDEYVEIEVTEDSQVLDLLTLARESKLHAVLPSLYLDISRLNSVEEIFDGIQRQDKSLYHLPQEDKLILAVGAAKMRAARTHYTLQWLKSVPYQACSSTRQCSRSAKNMFFDLSADPVLDDCDADQGLMDWDASWTENLCKHCDQAARREHNEGRFKFWENLPSYFGLPPWKELTNDDFE